jgi:hypothetical protein
VELLRRNKVGGLGKRSHHGRSLFGAALHPTSLVVVFRTLDVDVVVVVLDAVFSINLFVQLMTQFRKNPLLEHNPVNEGDKYDVENYLPKDFSHNMRGVEGNRDDFVPKGHRFIRMVMAGFGEVIDYHSHIVALMRSIRNN